MSLDEILNQLSPFIVGGGVGYVGGILTSIGTGVGYHYLRRHLRRKLLGEEPVKKKEIKKKHQKNIAVIPVTGMLTYKASKESNILSGGVNAIPHEIITNLKQVLNDRTIKGIVLDINCPGGYIPPSGELADYINNNLKRETIESEKRRKKNPALERVYEEKLPVVSLISGLGTSGGYLVAAASDYIISTDSSDSGSIGVFTMRFDFSRVLDEIGAKVYVIKAGKNKAEGLPFDKMSDKELENTQRKINVAYEWFIQKVSKYRKNHLTEEEVRELADGDSRMAQEAKRQKLIDGIGYFDDAIEMVEKLGDFYHTGIKNYGEKKSGISLQLPSLSNVTSDVISGVVGSILNLNGKPMLYK